MSSSSSNFLCIFVKGCDRAQFWVCFVDKFDITWIVTGSFLALLLRTSIFALTTLVVVDALFWSFFFAHILKVISFLGQTWYLSAFCVWLGVSTFVSGFDPPMAHIIHILSSGVQSCPFSYFLFPVIDMPDVLDDKTLLRNSNNHCKL